MADTGLGRLAEHAPSGNLGSYPTQDKEVTANAILGPINGRLGRSINLDSLGRGRDRHRLGTRCRLHLTGYPRAEKEQMPTWTA